jgi:hypothetical protein
LTDLEKLGISVQDRWRAADLELIRSAIEGRRVAKGSITSWVCDPTTNGFSAVVNETDYVLDQDGHQVTEMGSDANGSMAWAHTNVWAGGQLLATYSAVLGPPCQEGGTNCQPGASTPFDSSAMPTGSVRALCRCAALDLLTMFCPLKPKEA